VPITALFNKDYYSGRSSSRESKITPQLQNYFYYIRANNGNDSKSLSEIIEFYKEEILH
jgi:hypothetical protein